MIIGWSRYGKSYQFNATQFHAIDAPFPVYLVGTTGWGVAPSHQLVQRGPFQNGDTYVGYRLDPRIMQLPIVVQATDADDMMAKRNAMQKVFAIGTDNARIYVSYLNPTTKTRQIDVRVVGGVQFDTDARAFTIRAVVQLKANDPTWYSSVGGASLIGTVFGAPTQYPKPYPVTYGGGTANSITTIAYDGSADAYPYIQLDGPLSNVVIVDTLGHKIAITETIPLGVTWFIDLRYSVYTVTQLPNTNKFGALTIDSDLVNWRIYAESDAVPGGVNTISFSATGTIAGASNVFLNFDNRYIGV